MEFRSLRVQNFLGLTGPHTIPLSEQGIVRVTGQNEASRAADSNGASKTALMISAPCWILFGKTEGGRSGQVVRNRFDDGPTVGALEIVDGDRSYVVERQLDKHGEHFKVEGPGLALPDPKLRLLELIGFDWDFFRNVVAFGPNLETRFTRATDSQRKAIFGQILPDVDKLTRMHDDVDKDLKDLVREIFGAAQSEEQLRSQVSSTEGLVEEIERQRQLVSEIQFDHWADAVREVRRHEARRQILYESIYQSLILPTKVARVEAALAEVRRSNARVRDLRQEIDTRLGKVADRRERVAEMPHRLHEIVQSGRCSSCRRVIKPADEGKIREALLEEERALLADVAAFERQITLFREEESSLALDPQAEQDLLSALGKLREAPTLDSLKATIGEANRQIAAVEAKARSRWSPQPRKQHDAELTRLRGEIGKVSQALVSSRVEEARLEFWKVGFGNRGIKSRLLDGVEDFLDGRLRYYSQWLSAGEISIGFSSRTKLKKGEHRDMVSITAEHAFGAAELDLQSSGERQRIDLAVILALQDLARSQRLKPIRYSAFDEVFDHLDGTGHERLMALLLEERGERGTIALISQNPELLTYPVDHSLVVRKTRKGTEVLYDDHAV